MSLLKSDTIKVKRKPTELRKYAQIICLIKGFVPTMYKQLKLNEIINMSNFLNKAKDSNRHFSQEDINRHTEDGQHY